VGIIGIVLSCIVVLGAAALIAAGLLTSIAADHKSMLVVAVCIFMFGVLRIPYWGFETAIFTYRVVDTKPFVRAGLNRVGLIFLTIALALFVNLWASAVNEVRAL
jgi:hypothetical protein